MNQKNRIFFFFLIGVTQLFGGDIYDIMMQEQTSKGKTTREEPATTVPVKNPKNIAGRRRIERTLVGKSNTPAPRTTKKETQTAGRRLINKQTKQLTSPVLEAEKPSSMTTEEALEYLTAEMQKEKAQVRQYHQKKQFASEQARKKKQQEIEKKFNNLGLKKLDSQKDYETYKAHAKKLLPRLVKYADTTQTEFNDPLLKALEWHDFDLIFQLLKAPYKAFTNIDFKSHRNISGREFLDNLKDSRFATKYRYEDPREIEYLWHDVNVLLGVI